MSLNVIFALVVGTGDGVGGGTGDGVGGADVVGVVAGGAGTDVGVGAAPVSIPRTAATACLLARTPT